VASKPTNEDDHEPWMAQTARRPSSVMFLAGFRMPQGRTIVKIVTAASSDVESRPTLTDYTIAG
jgi:hypothetical protein